MFDTQKAIDAEPAAGVAPRHHDADALMRWLGRRHWLRHGSRYPVPSAWCHPKRRADRASEVPFAGFVYLGNRSRWIDWPVCCFGAYELDELQLLLREMVRGCPEAGPLDVGANVGHHSLSVASFSAQVHAFESFEDVACGIPEKIARNGLSSMRLHAIGPSDDDNELPSLAPIDHDIGNGAFVLVFAPGGFAPTCTLSQRQGDRSLQTLGVQRVDLVKIDVKGFELHVLAGLRETLQRFRPVIMLELGDGARDRLGRVEALLEMLPRRYHVDQIVRPSPRAGLFSQVGAHLRPLRWEVEPSNDGVVELLLRLVP